MIAKDGKSRLTDVVNTKDLLRLVQSIPSKKAEPFKMWLAQVGSERLDEIADPEKAIVRGADFYRAKGYTEGWINQRLQTIEMRIELTDEWKNHGITKEKDYAILSNEMTKAWSGMSVKEYKQLKGLKKKICVTIWQILNLSLIWLQKLLQQRFQNKKIQRLLKKIRRLLVVVEVFQVMQKKFEEETGKKAISPLNANNKDLLEIKSDEDK